MPHSANNIAPEKWQFVAQSSEESERIAQVPLTAWQDFRKRFYQKKKAFYSAVFIFVLLLLAIFGPQFSKYDYFTQELKMANLPPILSVVDIPLNADKSSLQRVYLSTSSFSLYGIDEQKVITGIVRAKKKDLMKKQQVFEFGDKQNPVRITLDYKTLPARLIDQNGQVLETSGWQWNRNNLLGTDHLGRDMMVRQFYGARISLAVAFVATLVNFFIGVFYGGLSGYLGGKVDMIMMRIVEIISTIPLTLYVILMMVLFDSGFLSIILAIGTVYWVDMARIVRGQILSLKQQDYISAAKTMGASTFWILSKHLLPNAIAPIIVTLTMLIPSAIFIESFMSFIGLGVTPPKASWGTLTREAIETLRAYPYQLFIPALAISMTMFAFNFLGDGLRDIFDPRLRR